MNGGKICVSVAAETADEMIAKIKRAEEFADVIEVRFDSLSRTYFNMDAKVATPAWDKILAAGKKPIVSTYRPKEQGGYKTLTYKERLTFWYGGMETEFADVEADVMIDATTQFFDRFIISHHDFDRVPVDVGELFERLAVADEMIEIVKIAAMTNDATDAIPIWNLLEESKRLDTDFIPIAMGEAGKWTRILGLAHGAYMTYASLDEASATADWQLTARDLVQVYRVKELTKDTEVYGVIGDPVSSSRSPYIQNAAFVDQRIDAVFIPLQVKNLDEFMRRMVIAKTREVELNFAGYSVTMPHKQSIMKYLDEIDAAAKEIGAVNTVKIDGEKLIGYNTDARGFIQPLKRKIRDLKGVRVAVIGAGGAARACVYALKQEEAEITLFARDVEKATTLDTNVRDLSSLAKDLNGFDILVNATPVGMSANDPPVISNLKSSRLRLVYDLVTSREDTPLIREAKLAGLDTISGREMLLEQGALQFEIWTGREAPRKAMADALTNR